MRNCAALSSSARASCRRISSARPTSWTPHNPRPAHQDTNVMAGWPISTNIQRGPTAIRSERKTAPVPTTRRRVHGRHHWVWRDLLIILCRDASASPTRKTSDRPPLHPLAPSLSPSPRVHPVVAGQQTQALSSPVAQTRATLPGLSQTLPCLQTMRGVRRKGGPKIPGGGFPMVLYIRQPPIKAREDPGNFRATCTCYNSTHPWSILRAS